MNDNKKADVNKPAIRHPNTTAAGKDTFSFRTLSIIFFCFVASFLGSWVFISTGLVRPDALDTINENRQEIVLKEGEVVADVAEAASASVVSIVTESVTDSDIRLGGFVQQGAGTGIVISRDGYIITNKHVLGDNTQSVDVVMSDDTTYEDVEVVGRDPLNDIAFLKIDGVSNLKPAKLGNSDSIEIGQKVIAIGNALGQFQNSVTSGIISGIGRPIVAEDAGGAERLEGLIQTDAAINPGNSGGPLMNLNGEVIGINTAIAEDAQGIGFSIPINFAKGLVKSVLEDGKVIRAYLGVQYVSITPQTKEEFSINSDVKDGAFVGGNDGGGSPVVAGSPADQAGLRAGDIITAVGGKTVDERSGLGGLIAQYSAGDQVTLDILRGNSREKITVTLGEYPQ